MNRQGIMQRAGQLGWPGESSVWHFVWGIVIVALWALTILRYVYLFGV